MDFESLCPVKSPNDDRTYEALILKNGIKLLLIHD
jgi:secreted Zn-dependent insulinase-like peptidase